jgi:hypothetical protein
MPPIRADPSVGADPEDVDMVRHAGDRCNRTRTGSIRWGDRKGRMPAILVDACMPPVGPDAAVRADPKDVYVLR